MEKIKCKHVWNVGLKEGLSAGKKHCKKCGAEAKLLHICPKCNRAAGWHGEIKNKYESCNFCGNPIHRDCFSSLRRRWHISLHPLITFIYKKQKRKKG